MHFWLSFNTSDKDFAVYIFLFLLTHFNYLLYYNRCANLLNIFDIEHCFKLKDVNSKNFFLKQHCYSAAINTYTWSSLLYCHSAAIIHVCIVTVPLLILLHRNRAACSIRVRTLLYNIDNITSNLSEKSFCR